MGLINPVFLDQTSLLNLPAVSPLPRCTYLPQPSLPCFLRFFQPPACALSSLLATTRRPALPPHARCPGLLGALRRRRAPPGTSAPCLPFPLCETEHPNPNLLFVFGSDLIASAYACIMPTNFNSFAKLSVVHAYTHVVYWIRPWASMAAEGWRGYRLWRASMRFHMRRSTCWRRLTLALLVWSMGTLLFCNCCKWLLKYMVSRFVFNLHIIDILAVTILGLLIMITLFVHELQFYLTTYTVHQVWLVTAYIFMCWLLYATFQCNIHRDFCSPLQISISFFPRHCEYACRK
jgi:hypothetical protein